MPIRAARVVVPVLLAVALAACGSDAETATGSSGAGIRCSGVALASMSALSGPDAGLGRAVARGAELAVAEFTEANPGCEVRLEQIDTQGLPERAPAAARRIAADEEVIGLVGPGFSGETLAAGPFLDEAGLAFVTPSATNPSLSAKGWAGFRRVPASDAALGAATARYIADRPDRGTVAVIDDGSTYGAGLADIVESGLGRTVAASLTIAPGAASIDEAVGAIAASGAGTVFFAGYEADSADLAVALRQSGSTARLVLSEGAFNPRFTGRAGRAGDGAVIVTSTAPESTVPEFAAAYRARFAAGPPAFAAEAYDAANALLAAVAAGARNRADVDAFLRTADLDGITRPLRWSGNGEPARARFRLVESTSDGFVDQGPVPAAVG